MALTTGTKAPDFTLKTKTAEGFEEVTLSSNFGERKTLLLFFPLAFSSVCTDELCSVSGGLNEFTGAGAAVYGISIDSPFALEAFAKQAEITIPLLSDFNKDVSKAYDVLDQNFAPGALGLEGVAKRSAFVVDQHGVIAFAWSSDNPKDLPPFDDVKAALEA
ncbi:MAG: redoxin domain-containing protein [Opitutales bacterium]